MSNERNGLKAWIRYDFYNKPVAGSLIYQRTKPTSGVWKEYIEGGNCNVNYGSWTLVTGGVAGDGTVLVDNLGNQEFTFVGPNDGADNGWVYLNRYFATETCLSIEYQWASFDGDTEYDRPVYWTSVSQPTGEPDNIDPKVGATPDSGDWIITVPAGEWFAVGIYSTDSCCGRGFLSVSIGESEGPCGV